MEIEFAFLSKKKMTNFLVDPDGVEALTLKVYNDADRAKVAKEIATECVGVTDRNPCNAGMKILQCMHEKAIAKGVSVDE